MTLFLLATALSISMPPPVRVDAPAAATSIVTSAATSCINNGMAHDYNGMLGCIWSTNTAPTTARIHPQHNYEQGSQTAAPLWVGAGIDEKKYTSVTRANCSGDTLTVTIDGTAVGLIENVDWFRGADDAASCASIEAAVDALVGADGTCSSGTVYVRPELKTVSLSLASSDATCATASNGTDANIVFHAHLASFNADGPRIRSQAAATNTPGILPKQSVTDAGFGYGSGGVEVVWGGQQAMTWSNIVTIPSSMTGFRTRTLVDNDVADLRINDNVYIDGGTTKGLRDTWTCVQESLTFAANPGDASKTTSALVPDGAFVKLITTRVTTAATNCTSVQIGDGTDDDMFSSATSGITAGTTTTNADATAFTRFAVAPAAWNVKVTANGGNCFTGVWRVTACYETGTAETSN